MSELYFPFLLAAFGSILQEICYWYNLRAKLDTRTYSKLVRSRTYWLLVFLMALGSGAGVVIWFYEALSALSPKDFVLLGAAFPAVFRLGVAAATQKQETTLGIGAGSSASIYFKR